MVLTGMMRNDRDQSRRRKAKPLPPMVASRDIHTTYLTNELKSYVISSLRGAALRAPR